MNQLGLLIDCSHVGDRTTREAIDASREPIAITHANPRWFCDHPRNKPDDVLAALAARGGVLGVTLYPPFLGGQDMRLGDFTAMVARLVDRSDRIMSRSERTWPATGPTRISPPCATAVRSATSPQHPGPSGRGGFAPQQIFLA